MSSNPVFSYKTSTVSGVKSTGASGKADTAPATGTPATSPTDTYLDQLESLGNAKMGKQTPPKTDTGSGDPVADLLTTLDQVSSQGVPTGTVPFAKISAEDALSKFPDSPEDVLSKYNSIIGILQKKLSDINTALANGGGTPQQVAAAQQLKSELSNLLSYYKIQRDKVAAIVVEKQKFWEKELQNFKETGGKSSVENFDKDDDGWIGRPEAKGSYRIGIRTFDKKYVDPVAKKMVSTALAKGIKLDLKYEFKKGDKQYWAVNPETNQRAQFDPISGKLIGEQVAAPGYTANLGTGFGNTPGEVKTNAKGELELKAGKATNAQNFADAGLELYTPEHIWVEVDADGEPVLSEDGRYKPYSFKVDENHNLIQNTPPLDGDTHYKQIYVKKMEVSTDSKDGDVGGDIVVQLRGGDDNVKLLSLRITGSGKTKNASDVALAITSGPEGSHRETPIILDAGSYQSTCRQGMSQSTFKEIFKDGSGEAPDMNNAQIQDTFKHFEAQGSGEISSLRNRGITFKTQGHIVGTDDNDIFVQEEPAPYLGPDDPAYASVIEGGNGNNALFGKKGSVFANGMTLVSKDSGDANDEISIGINAYGEEKSKLGTLQSTKGKSSNKLYIRVNAAESDRVAIQSAVDGIDDKSKAKSPDDPMAWTAGDDYYSIKAKVIATTAVDGNNPNQPFDPDLQKKGGKNPIQGKITSAATADFTVGSKAFMEHIKNLEDSIKKKASDNSDFDWQIEGAKLDWMQGKFYKGDKNMLETFFGDFSASKLNEIDPFQQLSEGMEQATGGEE